MSKNTPGLGIEFEVLAPAYFCLKLIANDNVEDFSVRTNEKGFGNLDDSLFQIKLKNKKELFFAFQLKHAENSKNITPESFCSSGNFDLRKYCETFSKFDEEKKKYHIILYTNREFDHQKMRCVKKFVMKPQQNCPGEIFFATTEKKDVTKFGNIYKFGINNYDKDDLIFKSLDKECYDQFFERFSLYVGQSSSRDFQNKIKDVFKEKYSAELADNYFTFFRDWHKGEFTDNRITKEIVVNKLLTLLFNNCLLNNLSLFEPSKDGDKNIVEEAVNSSDITLVEGLDVQHLVPENDKNYCNQDLLKEGRNLKIIPRYAKELSKEQKDNILRFSGQKPFLVEFNERSKSYIQAALEVLCKSTNRKHNLKLIIIGKEIDSSQLPLKELRVLKNLHDLRIINTSIFKEIMQKFQVSLQGKTNVYIGKVNAKITKLIPFSVLLECLKGNLIIGEKEEMVFENYMSRVVTAPCFSSEFLLKLKSDLLVINCGEHLEQIEKKLQGIASNKKIMQIQEIGDASLKNEIILTVDDLFLQDFRKNIAEFKGNVHYLKTIGEDSFQWIETEGNIQNLKSDDKLKLNKIPERDIFTHFKNTVNVICAQPGMGKSVMMEQLRINGPSDFWGVKMEFRELESTFEKFTANFDDNFYNFEHEFLKKTAQNGLQTEIVHVLTARRQIYFFFDGLDELQSKHLETAMNFMKELSARGFMLWISARKNLQDMLEKNFNVLALNIEEIPRETQVYYVEERLQYSHDSQEIQEVIQKIFTNLQVLSNSEVLGVPLQLFILTEVLIEDKKRGYEFHENIFIMTKMYESFFRGKLQHYLDKNPSENYAYFVIESVYEHYEKAALTSCLDDEFLESLNVQGLDRCLKWISDDVSKIGIITKIINGRPVFHHNTHAEYFAACYFARNRDREWNKTYLFQAKYKNIRLMLDIKLAEKSEPHLSVIYKDWERLRAIDKRQIKCKDQAGRSPLHLACSYGETFPLLDVKENVIQDGDKHDINKSNLDLWRKIVKFLLENDSSPFENDDFLKLNAIQYADAYLCLAAFEEILEIKRDNQRQFMKNFKKNLTNYSKQFSSIIYYSTKFNFVNLFGLVKDTLYTFNPLEYFFNSSFSTLLMTKNQENETLLHIAAENKRIDMVNLILAESVSKKLINAVDIYSRTVLDVAILVQDPQIQKILESKGAVTSSEKYPFHRAASNGYDKIIKLLLSQQSDDELINSVDDRNWTALDHACRSGHLLTCDLLINSGASIEQRTADSETPLFLSVMFCRLEIMNLLLSKGANVNSRYKNMEHLLHVAVRDGNVQVIKILLDAKADIGAKDDNGEEALHIAVRYDNTAALKILLNAKVDIGAKDNNGEEALHFAVRFGNSEALKILLDAKADIGAKDNNGKEALHFAARYGNAAALKILLDAKADIGAKDNNGEEALHFAARYGYAAALKILLDAKADIGAKDNNGEEALHFAVRFGKTEALNLFLNVKADIRAKYNDGEEALHFAARYYNIEALKILLDAKADIGAKDNNGEEALHFAVRFGNSAALKILLDAKADIKAKDNNGKEALHFAVRFGTSAALKILLDAKADIGSKDNNGQEALHIAVKYRNTAAVKILLEAKANIGAKDNNGEEVLHFAVRYDNTAALKILLDAKADIGAKDNNGKEALHFAARYGDTAALKILLDAKADIGSKDNNGQEALHIAVKYRNTAAVKILLEAKADITAKDKLGRQALHMAALGNKDEVFKLLVNDFKADVNAVTNAGESALHLAAADWNYPLVRLLLNLRVNVNALDNNGRTALQRAETSQYRRYSFIPLYRDKIVKQLIDAGAKI